MLRQQLDDLPVIDWDDVHAAAEVAEAALRRIAVDKAGLREMLLSVPDDLALFSKCETDTVEDKIVLYDNSERGLRLRLRMATARQRELAHAHRFSFSNLVLRGAYTHRNYECRGVFSEDTRRQDILPVCIHEDAPGDCFTIHHSAIHATPLEEAGTISLVLRGPAAKLRAPVVPKSSGRSFSRIGEGEESAERRALRQMNRNTFDQWVTRLTDYGIL